MMPERVRSWVAGASRNRLARDLEQAKADSLQQSADTRADWLHTREQQLQFQHQERLIAAEQLWPKFMEEAEQEFINRTVMVFDGRYG